LQLSDDGIGVIMLRNHERDHETVLGLPRFFTGEIDDGRVVGAGLHAAPSQTGHLVRHRGQTIGQATR
jgi:hypothetical protein